MHRIPNWALICLSVVVLYLWANNEVNKIKEVQAPKCYIEEKGLSDNYRIQAIKHTYIDCTEDYTQLKFTK